MARLGRQAWSRRAAGVVAPLLAIGLSCGGGADVTPPRPPPLAPPPAGGPSGGADGGAAEPGDARFDPIAAAAGEPPPGSTTGRDRPVRVLIEAEPLHLEPELEPDAWGRRIAVDAIYEPLVRLHGEVVEPMLADHWSVDGDGTRYLFHLREGVVFHDGRPLTSLDVAQVLDRVRSQKSHLLRARAGLADVERVEMAGRGAVRIELRRAAPRLLEVLAEIPIGPARGDETGDAGRRAASRRPIGTGPYRLLDWQHRRLTLQRFDQYWGERPAAPRIEFAVEPDAARALFLGKRHDVDVLGYFPVGYFPEQLEGPAMTAAFQAVRVHSPRLCYVLWNARHPPLDDAAVRRGLSLVVDRQRIVDEARHGLARPIDTVPAGAGGEPDRANPTRAAAVLDAAGLPRGASGVRTRGGKPVRLTLLVPAGSREAAAIGRRLAEAVGRAGVPVDVVSLDLPQLLLRVKRGAFDGALLEWNGVDDDDLDPIIGSHAAYGAAGVDDRAIDAALEGVRREPRASEAGRGAARALAAAVAQAQPALFLYGADDVYLYARRLAPIEETSGFARLRDLRPR